MKKKVIVRIDSGLGNQLFQYACGYSIARKKNYELRQDPFFIGDIRTYQLDQFNLDYSKHFLNSWMENWIEKKGYDRALQYRDWKRKRYQYIVEQNEFTFDKSIYESQNNIYLKGFWQSYLYFDQYYEDIRRQFSYKRDLSERTQRYIENMRQCNSVSMHVRRTDYVRAVDNVSIDLDYYDQALRLMKRKIGDFKLFIFSDDKEYIRDKFRTLEYDLVENISDIEEFICMQNCKHHIIANSTFSWWAAYLADNKGNEVIAPVNGIWKEDFYLPQWNKIQVAFE